MPTQLTEIEARVLGCLVEKSLTTPEAYPLSMNALVSACNQKTSREPVMSLTEGEVGQGLHTLLQKELASRNWEPGARVPKFSHHFEKLLTLASPKETGALCVLLLRGAQTPGEIKNRAERLCEFDSPAEAESVLQELAVRADGPFVAKLSRAPGQKEARYQHLFCGAAPAPAAPAEPASAAAPAAVDRFAELEKRVAALEARVAILESRRPSAELTPTEASPAAPSR